MENVNNEKHLVNIRNSSRLIRTRKLTIFGHPECPKMAKNCPKCGAPVPGWLDKLPDSVQAILGFLIIGVILYGLIWNFFLKNPI